MENVKPTRTVNLTRKTSKKNRRLDTFIKEDMRL